MVNTRSTDEAQIHELIERYHDGLYRGDTQLLAEVFHPEARYASASGEEFVHLDMATYLPLVARRPSPESVGEPREWRVVSIQFAGPVTACVRARSTMLGKRFDDFLLLVRSDGRWRVLSKVFHHEPGRPGDR